MNRFILIAVLALPTFTVWAEDGAVRIAEEIVPAKVAASSTFSPAQAPTNLLGEVGMTGDRHDKESGASTMWHTEVNPTASVPAAGLPAASAWVRFDFTEPHKIGEVRIWNHNQVGNLDRGFGKARLYGSADGTTWFPLGAGFELARGGDAPADIQVASDKPIKAVILSAESNHGGNCYGLSHVRFEEFKDVAPAAAPFPSSFACEPKPFYGHRADGKAGREVRVKFAGGKLYAEADLKVAVSGGPTETVHVLADPHGASERTLLLPEGVSAEKEAQVEVTLASGGRILSRKVVVPAKRQWTVFIYPHSHVDIGYTNTAANVEAIHKHNLVEGIKLARETADWPEGSRFVWNPEVTWPIERYLATATPQEREGVLEAIRKGWVSVDAGYINDDTSVACDEEFFPFMGYKRKLEAATGVKMDTLVQVDVPGMSWGVVPAAAESGVRHILAFHNGSDRTGHTNDLNFKPFWWESPDGKSRVLFFQPGSYVPGARIKGYSYAVSIMGKPDPVRLLPVVKTDNPRAHFCDQYFMPTTQMLEGRADYPYDIFVMSWSMADNTPVDVDLPAGVRSWNAEYAYPHLVIAGSKTIMDTLEKKYGAKLPVRRGDFTEYWTDGLGSAAKQTGMNRASKERLIQADTLWTMLRGGTPVPRAEFEEAWRNVVLGSEHTWCYSNPHAQPITNNILAEKFGRFQKAEDGSKDLLAKALAPVVAPGGNKVAVFNTLSWDRSELVTLSAAQSADGDGVKDEAGNPVPSQRLSTGELVFFAKAVPALGAKNYTVGGQAGAAVAAPVKADGLVLDNGIVKATLDPKTGDISSLVMDGREFVDPKAPCALNSYRYLHGGDSGERATKPTEVKIALVEKGPLVASFRVVSKAEGCKSLVRTVRLEAGSAQVACDDLVDKLPVMAKEGVHFGFAFDLPGARTRMDIPWGVAEVEKDQFKEGNRNWICFQRWLDVSNSQAGVAWCSLDAPTFEYGQMSANIIGGALNSRQWIRELKPSSTIYSWALNNHWHTNFPLSQEGAIPFRYRLLPHAGGFDAAAANRFGTAQAQPLVAAQVKEKVVVVPPVKLDNPRVAAVILRSEEGGKATLRLRSLSDKTEEVTLAFPSGKSQGVVLAPWGMASVEVGE